LRSRLAGAPIVAIVVGFTLGACAQSVRSDAKVTAADSIVLERTVCFGTCPAYRLSLTRQGQVSFESRNPGDTSRHARDSVSVTSLGVLTAMADSLGFETLPDTIANDSALCPDKATDHPTATITIFRGVQSKHVVDYHGCFASVDHSTVPAVARLRQLETAIDSLAGSQRWVRPASRR
jgi:hypothetical protein